MSKTRSRKSRLTWWVGVAMMTAGVAMLGWVGWQFWGTNWVSQREQARVTDSLRSQWTKGDTTSGVALAPTRVPKGKASALVQIPRFGKSYVVPVLEGVSTRVLTKGLGHFPGTAHPGEVGNYALAGHRVTHGEPLREMPRLRPGDEVIVETVDATHVYRMDTDPEKLVIPFTGVWVLDPLPKNPEPGGPQPEQRPGQRLITLTTCSEIFHTDDRMIAFGHLVRTTAKAR